MKDISFVAVSGFIGSGSSAVVDLLKEYKGAYECRAEIRTIKDPYGIRQMEQALTDNWELLNSAAAIRDFLWLSKICARPGRFPLAPAGLGYSKTISKDFMAITQRYVDKLTKFTYKSDFYYQKFKKPYPRYVIDRCRWAVEYLSKGKIKLANRNMKPSHFAHPTHAEFNQATQEYFLELFQEHAKDGEKTYILLDQAISPNDTQVIHRYFSSAKMIIVDRDPRDMYIDDMLWVENLDNDVHTRAAGERYILRHKALRSNVVKDTDVLYIRFEDLILNYEDSVKKIEAFLGFDSADHIQPNTFLKPEKSAKNIGIWKQYYEKYKDALDAIAEGLPEYCRD